MSTVHVNPLKLSTFQLFGRNHVTSVLLQTSLLWHFSDPFSRRHQPERSPTPMSYIINQRCTMSVDLRRAIIVHVLRGILSRNQLSGSGNLSCALSLTVTPLSAATLLFPQFPPQSYLFFIPVIGEQYMASFGQNGVLLLACSSYSPLGLQSYFTNPTSEPVAYDHLLFLYQVLGRL